jgi:hypothetical protein
MKCKIAYNVNDFYSIYDDSRGYCYFGTLDFTAFSLVLRNVFGSSPHFWVRIFAIFMTIQRDIAISEPRIFPALAPLFPQPPPLPPHLPHSLRSLLGLSRFSRFPRLDKSRKTPYP